MRRILVFAAVAFLAVPACAADPRTTAALRDKALTDSTAWDVLESLTTEIGPRPVGSAAALRARDWALAKLKALGFTNVHAEPFAKPSWARGAESAEVLTPYPQKLAVIGLGGSVPTPPQGIEAPIVVLKTYADLLAAPLGAFKNKIVVVNQPMTRAQDGSGYGKAVAARYGATEAAKRGAVAYLVRSISTGNARAPHTGSGTYGPKASRIPEAALGVPDADLLERMAARGPVRLRLKLASFLRPRSVAWNVSGEIAGSARPDQVIVVGGHLDSWDSGTGAVDDGAGVAITTAAARLIGQLPRHPRRTIRVVMWGSEETGGSSGAYLAAHKGELAKIVVASESDLGSDRVYRLKLPQGALARPQLKPLAGILAPLKVAVSPEPVQHAGSDVEGLQKAGVPVFSLDQDASRYFDFHHSADDTLAIVDRAQLNQNVAAWAVLLYLIADSDVDFRA
ncbi:MAG TPA: M20/M25/M40 family metallo-hydrolase, partial [Rhizomicrobium sp.]